MSQKSNGRSRKQKKNSSSRHAATAAQDQDYSFETETGSQPFPPLESEGTSQQLSQKETTTTRGGDILNNRGSDYHDENPSRNDGFSSMGNAATEEAGVAAEVEVEVEDDADFQSQYSLENDNENSSSGERDGESISGSEHGLQDDDGNDDEEDQDGEDDQDLTQENEDYNNNIAMHRPFMQSTGSLHGPNNAFAPPFYNRPPTPLPPSPSLTSLLRPPFSTTTSRPTTPDTSDAETPNDTEAAVAKSARHATTVPRASPKVPTYEYYGFVLYLASSFAFLIYLLWSYLPSPFLHQLGIYYYPNRWWSLAIPSFLVMTIVYIYIALASYNTGYLTLPMNSIENIVDEAANIAVIDGKGRRRVGGSEKMKMKPGAVTAQTINNNHNNHNNYNNQGYGYGYGNNTSSNNCYYPAAGGSGNNSHKGHHHLNWREIWSEGTDAVMDIPVGGVCEILYGQGRERDPQEEDDDDGTEEELQAESDRHGFVSPSSSHGQNSGLRARKQNQGVMRW